MATKTAPQLLTIPQSAVRIGSSERHVYRLIRDGELSVVDIGRPGSGTPKSRIPEPELAAYIERRTSNAKRLRTAG